MGTVGCEGGGREGGGREEGREGGWEGGREGGKDGGKSTHCIPLVHCRPHIYTFVHVHVYTHDHSRQSDWCPDLSLPLPFSPPPHSFHMFTLHSHGTGEDLAQ